MAVTAMRPVWTLWVLALVLKFLGASWDVSWHFRTVRESISPPHILNGAGELLFVALLWHEWRRRTPERTMPLRVVAAGMLVWLAAVPLDEAWHRIYGLDLTTWSPSHLMLFYGTAIAVAGLALLLMVDLGWRPGPRAFDARRAGALGIATLAGVALFAAEAVLFPLTYSEHTTVAADNAIHHPERLDPQLLEMALTVSDPVFHGTPPWLYPVYCAGAVAMLAVLMRRAVPLPGFGVAILGGYAVIRFAIDAALGAVEYPQAVVPWQYVPMALAWEAAWLLPRARDATRACIGAALATLAAYASWAIMPRFMLAIPISPASWPGALMAAFAGAAFGWLLWDLAASAPSAEPIGVAMRRRFASVEREAREMVARFR